MKLFISIIFSFFLFFSAKNNASAQNSAFSHEEKINNAYDFLQNLMTEKSKGKITNAEAIEKAIKSKKFQFVLNEAHILRNANILSELQLAKYALILIEDFAPFAKSLHAYYSYRAFLASKLDSDEINIYQFYTLLNKEFPKMPSLEEEYQRYKINPS